MGWIHAGVLLLGLALVAVPLASAQGETSPPAPTGLGIEFTEEGGLLLSWEPPAPGLGYLVYRNNEFLGTSNQATFLDVAPLAVAVYEVTATSESSESQPSEPLLVMIAGTAQVSPYYPPAVQILPGGIVDHVIKMIEGYPPQCFLVGIAVLPEWPFAGAYVNQNCLDAWLNPHGNGSD